MNWDDPRHPWARLTRAARTVRDDRDATAPAGFATRVAALAMGNRFRPFSLLEHYAWRALGVAGLLAVLSVVVNFSALSVSPEAEDEDMADSAITLLLTVD